MGGTPTQPEESGTSQDFSTLIHHDSWDPPNTFFPIQVEYLLRKCSGYDLRYDLGGLATPWKGGVGAIGLYAF